MRGSMHLQLAFKFVPSREDFLDKLGPKETMMDDLHQYTTTFSATLADIHKYLVRPGQDLTHPCSQAG